MIRIEFPRLSVFTNPWVGKSTQSPSGNAACSRYVEGLQNADTKELHGSAEL